MKRFVSMLLVLILLSAMIVPVLADGLSVIFTGDSLPQVGGFLAVNWRAMMEDDSVTSEIYNALLEKNVIYQWYKNGALVSEGLGDEGSVYQLIVSDGGCSIYVKMCFYEDAELKNLCAELTSETKTILPAIPAPVITTTSLPDATVGKSYYVKLECTDPDAAFSEFMGSQLSEFGLTLTQHGEIEGTPTKAGRCQVNIAVSGEGGEDSKDFAIQVQDVVLVEPEITTTSLPNAEVGKSYSVQLSCTDPKAQFGEYYNPNGGNDLKKTGLTLTGTGELKGTPTTAGTYAFTVYAAGEGGEGYMTYTLTVQESTETTAPSETTEATAETTEATEAPTDDTAEGTEPLATYAPQQDGGDSGSNWWIFLVIAVAGIGLGIGLALFLVKRKK